MKIYTRKGDKGNTVLLSGERVPKNDTRIEAYGNIDELISYLGLIRDLTEDKETETSLLNIQSRLMVSASLLAAGKPGANLPQLREDDILKLERDIDRMSKQLPALHHFILPGGHPVASHCHVARTICRRAERQIVSLIRDNPSLLIVLQYLNRLSDYLFILARYIVHKSKSKETPWLSED